MRLVGFGRTGRRAHRRRSSVAMVALAGVVAVTSCGVPADEPAGESSGPPATPAASAPPPSGSSPTADSGVLCRDGAVPPADLATAQFAFVGRVVSVVDEIQPWTTDPENADRPEDPTTTPWVTFEVELWYLNDWGGTFSVWMPGGASTGQRLAVGGNAYFTQVADFAGQSGEVEFCTSLADDDLSPADWDAAFGEPAAPTSTAVTTTLVLEPTKVFGEHDGPCAPTVLTNGNDDQSVLDEGVACFIEQFQAGRPLVWDVLIPTVEGDPIVTRYEYDGASVVITTDNSFDNFGSGGVLEQRCLDILATSWLPGGVDCTTSAGVGFVESSLVTQR